jgi:hypothetical protein
VPRSPAHAKSGGDSSWLVVALGFRMGTPQGTRAQRPLSFALPCIVKRKVHTVCVACHTAGVTDDTPIGASADERPTRRYISTLTAQPAHNDDLGDDARRAISGDMRSLAVAHGLSRGPYASPSAIDPINGRQLIVLELACALVGGQAPATPPNPLGEPAEPLPFPNLRARSRRRGLASSRPRPCWSAMRCVQFGQ